MIYTIKKDTNNDTKFRIPDILTGKFKKTWKVSLSPECWYPKELGYNQINKLVGVTEFWSANNKNSVMVGWDPCYLSEEEILEKYPHCKNLINPIEDLKYFNIYYYTNDKDGGHTAIQSTVVADWRINDVVYTLERTNNTNSLVADIDVLQFAPVKTEKSIVSGYNEHKIDVTFPLYLKGMLREIFIWFGGTRKAPWNMLFKVN